MFRRLEELLRQMAQASKVMGSEELEKKFEEALSKVKRGMFPAGSARFPAANMVSRYRCRRVSVLVILQAVAGVLYLTVSYTGEKFS